jgi:hypothetical protein
VKDADFKSLPHRLRGGERIATRGQEVLVGYKPDVTIRDERDRLTFILESEQKTDRKAFLGDLLKAEFCAEREGSNPALIIVMKRESNTTPEQIANHLRQYAQWLAAKQGGSLYLSRIQVVSDEDYAASISVGECISSPEFMKRGVAVAVAL